MVSVNKTVCKPKKVIIWSYDLDQDLLKYLRSENIDVVALLVGISDEVPSFSIFDLFYRTEKIPFREHISSPVLLSDAFLHRYLNCISRLSFFPTTEKFNCLELGIVGADNVVDWAQFQAQTVLRVLQHYCPDEIWMNHPPHSGLDNLFFEVGRQLGLTVLTFHQSIMPGKFFYKVYCDEPVTPRLQFVAPPVGGFKPNLFYMRQDDWLSPHERLMERMRFYVTSPFKGQRKQIIERLYIAAQRREWALLLLLMDCLCKRSREIAFTRFVRRLRFRSEMKKRIICHQEDLQKPFVFFALHLQPEMSTSALGGYFSNQMNAIEAIREILPKGWWICIKENPKQRYMCRDLPFYERARQWSEVKFINDSAGSEELIKQARIIATITGMVGYEALLLGKPCVYFGEAWYEGLPNALRFSKTLDLEEISCRKVDAQELSKAVEVKMTEAADGVVYPRHRALLDGNMDWSDLMKTTAKSLVRISDAAHFTSDSV